MGISIHTYVYSGYFVICRELILQTESFIFWILSDSAMHQAMHSIILGKLISYSHVDTFRYRDYFNLRQQKGIGDCLQLEGYKIAQIESRIQYDDYNCGVITLKVCMVRMHVTMSFLYRTFHNYCSCMHACA